MEDGQRGREPQSAKPDEAVAGRGQLSSHTERREHRALRMRRAQQGLWTATQEACCERLPTRPDRALRTQGSATAGQGHPAFPPQRREASRGKDPQPAHGKRVKAKGWGYKGRGRCPQVCQPPGWALPHSQGQ